ncbi:unnamed protein product, partial [marine sediment metagenome]
NRFIVSIIKNSKYKDTITLKDEYEFTHLRYIDRGFAFLMRYKNPENKFLRSIFLDKVYPSGSGRFNSSIEKELKLFYSKIRIRLNDAEDIFNGDNIFPFKAPMYEFEKPALPYFDYAHFKNHKKKIHISSYTGTNNNCPTELYSHGRPFDEIDTINDILNLIDNCNHCKKPLYFSEQIDYSRNNISLCTECSKIKDIFIKCMSCLCSFYIKEITEINQHKFCKRCADNIKVCNSCGEIILDEDYKHDVYSHSFYCSKCSNDLVNCFS